MAKNTGQNHRHGAVKGRSQLKNPLINQYVKRDLSTGRFVDVKLDGTKFKGVTTEK